MLFALHFYIEHVCLITINIITKLCVTLLTVLGKYQTTTILGTVKTGKNIVTTYQETSLEILMYCDFGN